jgi:hypothetical protein
VHHRLVDLEDGEGGDAPDGQRAEDAPALQLRDEVVELGQALPLPGES